MAGNSQNFLQPSTESYLALVNIEYLVMLVTIILAVDSVRRIHSCIKDRTTQCGSLCTLACYIIFYVCYLVATILIDVSEYNLVKKNRFAVLESSELLINRSFSCASYALL